MTIISLICLAAGNLFNANNTCLIGDLCIWFFILYFWVIVAIYIVYIYFLRLAVA